MTHSIEPSAATAKVNLGRFSVIFSMQLLLLASSLCFQNVLLAVPIRLLTPLIVHLSVTIPPKCFHLNLLVTVLSFDFNCIILNVHLRFLTSDTTCIQLRLIRIRVFRNFCDLNKIFSPLKISKQKISIIRISVIRTFVIRTFLRSPRDCRQYLLLAKMFH